MILRSFAGLKLTPAEIHSLELPRLGTSCQAEAAAPVRLAREAVNKQMEAVAVGDVLHLQ